MISRREALAGAGVMLGAMVLPAAAQQQTMYGAEDGVTLYVAEDGMTNYAQEALNPLPPLQIGAPVVGAAVGMCLTVDADGNLAQANCLLAQ